MNAVQLQLQGRRRRRVVTRIITSSTLFFLGLFKKFSTMIFAATITHKSLLNFFSKFQQWYQSIKISLHSGCPYVIILTLKDWQFHYKKCCILPGAEALANGRLLGVLPGAESQANLLIANDSARGLAPGKCAPGTGPGTTPGKLCLQDCRLF
ncbi:transmembrane protein, putative [Medicago truncatula]|uniref:Transmembrane protein, putative n=1 Tax=Medicago truncatula TaxID=3880 RepID=G7KGW1_MEDTR|nr:transmembrane protein, putative [Medicago truncatula]